MDFVDRTLVQMASGASRNALFDDAALEQMLDAAYDTSSVPVEAPFDAVFDKLELGFGAFHQAHGKAQLYGGPETSDVLLQLSDWQADAALRVDALWTGSIIARSTPDSSVIENVSIRLPALGAIDAAVAADNGGALPQDPDALEQARRAELIEQLRSGLALPEAIDETRIDRLLADMKLPSVEALLKAGTGMPASLTIGFSPADDAPPTPQIYPVKAALIVRDAGFSIADLLFQSKLLRMRLQGVCCSRKTPEGLLRRRELLVAWVVPEGVFDDADWPGAGDGMNAGQARAARRAATGAWLAEEGIGLIVIGA